MPFQVPPTLPDYSKLTFLLNNSGIQKWNPAVYDILKQLILAVSQSQAAITQNIDDIPPPDPFGGVFVNGALDGDGLVTNPLAVRVDGSTIIINGSDNLEVIAGNIFVARGTIADGAFVAGSIITLLPAVAGKAIIPLNFCAFATITASGLLPGQDITGHWQYTSALRSLGNFTIITGGLTGSRQQLEFPITFNIESANEILNNNVELALTGTTPGGFTTTTTYRWAMAYILL